VQLFDVKRVGVSAEQWV